MGTSSTSHRFGDFVLDPHSGRVTGPAGDVPLRPKAHALLTHLASNLGRIVPKAELLDAVWPNVYVQEDSLTQAIREVRKGLGDNGELLRNVSGRGYILTGAADPLADEHARLPVVAVLRFRNDNEAATDNVLIDGFAEDIVSGLARSGMVTVIARSSSFQFASYESLDDRQLAQKLGADYLIEGAISRRGDDATITVGMTDARTLARLWGERYEAGGLELFTVQREIAAQVVNRITRKVGHTTLARAQLLAPNDLTVYDHVVRAAAILNHYGVEDPGSALEHLDLAIARDPGYALGHALRALAVVMIGGMGLASPAVLKDARAQADRAVALGPEQPVAYRILATVQIFQRQHDAAEATLRTSLALNPSDADAVGSMGHLLILRGRPLDGRTWLDRAARLDPVHGYWYAFSNALAAYQLGEYAECLRLMSQLPEALPHLGRLRVAATAMAGKPVAGFAALAETLQQVPHDDPFGWEHASDLAHIREGEQLARQVVAP